MKRVFVFAGLVAVFLMLIPFSLALNLEVEKTSSGEVMIADLNKPAQFNLKITNNGPSDSIEFYNLLGFEISPSEKIPFASGETKEIVLEVSPIGSVRERGNYILEYFIKGQTGPDISQKLEFSIINLKDAFEVGSGNIDVAAESIQIYIHNRNNFDFGNMKAKFSSAFFDFEEEFSLGPYERKNFDVQLSKEEFKSLMAGFYTLNVDVEVEGKKARTEGIIKYVEKDIVTASSTNYGFVINTESIKKTNEGNIIAGTETIVRKNIISRLFTTLTPEPDSVERQGFTVYYSWSRQLNPGETLGITVRTNWLFPLLVIALIIAIILLVKQYSKTNIVLKKRVNFVRAKGGEFALKVSIFVQAKKYIERVNIIDRLPPLVKLYENYGGEKPTRVDEKTRKLEWNFEKLEPGETRALSYIIFSKVGILGKFALPTASAIYEKDGEINETDSNRAYFIAEPRVKDPDEK
ncbi:MAG: hypothetical protein WD876_01600 [Candidatus Pacearchaeota archaeon]